LHVAVDLQVPEQEELRIVAGFRRIERSAQRLSRLRGADEMRRDLYAWPSPMLVLRYRRSSSMESETDHLEPRCTQTGSMDSPGTFDNDILLSSRSRNTNVRSLRRLGRDRGSVPEVRVSFL
jgi:hypothetical protein